MQDVDLLYQLKFCSTHFPCVTIMSRSYTTSKKASKNAEGGINWQVEDLVASSASLVRSTSKSYTDGAFNKKPPAPICQGKVSRLEDKVPELWWKTVFSDSMYLKTDGDVVEDPDITRDELRSLVTSIPETLDIFTKGGLSEGGKVLDLCCGQGRHSLQLCHDYPNLKVHGHDQSSYLITLARVRI